MQSFFIPRNLVADKDVVDGDVDELDEEADEAHDAEADAGGLGDGRELLPVGLGALLHEVHGVLHELLQGLHNHGVDVGHGGDCAERKPSRARRRGAGLSGSIFAQLSSTRVEGAYACPCGPAAYALRGEAMV